MTPGTPLTPDEAQHVEDTLVRLIQESTPNGRGGLFGCPPRQLLKSLGWSYDRFYDVRGYVEGGDCCRRVGQRIGQRISCFLSHGQFSITTLRD